MDTITREIIFNTKADIDTDMWIEGYVFRRRILFTRGNLLISSVPKYSSNISDAWKVVEEIKSRGWCPNVVYHASDNQWWCEFFNNMAMRNANADTPELAICRAALLVQLEKPKNYSEDV